MRKTSNKTDGQNEGKKTTQVPEAINAPTWGVFTTLAWIKFRNVEIVNKVFETAFRSGGDTRETEKILAKCSSEKFILNTQAILRTSLLEGKVDCSGIRNGSREKIDRQKWEDLDFYFPFPPIEKPVTLEVSQIQRVIKDPTWRKHLFTVSQVMEVWPDDGDNNKQQSNSKKNKAREYKPRNIFYKKALKKLIELDHLDYGWQRLIEVTPGIRLNNDGTLVIGHDEFNSPIDVKVKSFRNAVSKMRGHLKNKKE